LTLYEKGIIFDTMAKANSKKNLTGSSWAIRPEALKTLASSGFVDNVFNENGSIAQKNFVYDLGNGIKSIHIDGPLSYRSDVLSAIFGTDTYDSIGDAFKALVADPDVLGIVLEINSPGGEVAGCSDLSDLIFSARGTKPYGITARIGGMGCSAAYWIASSAEKVLISESGAAGSIGVIAAFDAAGEETERVITSDLSPNKNPNPDDPAGLAAIKKNLNDLASVFISAVARNRNVSFESVIDRFGGGSVFVGQKAVDAGLADNVMSIDYFIKQRRATMANEKEQQASATDAAVKAAVEAERTRVSAIRAAFSGLNMEAECDEFISAGKSADEARAKALDESKKKLAEKDENIPPVGSPEQLALIKKGLAAEAAAQNNIKGSAPSEEKSAAEQRMKWAAEATAQRYSNRRK
jgi:capsid assembly protease